MPANNKFRIALLSVVMTIGFATLNAQILRDSISLKILKREVDNIYNLQFKEAGDNLQKISKKYPGHPIVMLLEGMITYWKNYPLTTTTLASSSYESEMKICIERCEKFNQEDEAEFLLTNLCARGMLLMFYADNNLSSEVIPLATTTYHYVRRSFDFTNVYSDFFFFTGLYDYYREAYPDAHPVYKSFSFLFPRGDRLRGLENLKRAASESIFLKAESASFLNSIYLRFESDFESASGFSKALHELYPSNSQHSAGYIKNLLLENKYELAENIMKASLSKYSDKYFKAQLTIFEGIIQEKKYRNLILADECYRKGLSDLSQFSDYGNEYAAYAYFGLARISAAGNDSNKQKQYQKKAVGIAESNSIDFNN